ncbi:uncharacterized protein FOMMEDRAFT_161728 [Fomitiporia mediterranea MF3/22]|uniref:uncharacterized protein n=1 Tax=Fomitiporia mediterranea (strain MF3/22) TaxID=694068 RepID=UPI00044092CF|nr:uncharacterized protein FOMMEDRAFT_161728 [Fomitiporia mediterranea MF3/22]EJC98361.1 hypothetical protein FOMMEDRAFT_161728 [Fomitiporia mediterranea MF3/22]
MMDPGLDLSWTHEDWTVEDRSISPVLRPDRVRAVRDWTSATIPYTRIRCIRKFFTYGIRIRAVYAAGVSVNYATVRSTICHTSFRDYLLSPERQKDPWFIDLESQKEFIASQCLTVMRDGLRFNICNIKSSYISNNQITDLPDRIKANIPAQLEYVCLFWNQHLCDTQFSLILLDELSEFLYKRLLYWIEVMSLLGKINYASPALFHAMNWVSLHNAD